MMHTGPRAIRVMIEVADESEEQNRRERLREFIAPFRVHPENLARQRLPEEAKPGDVWRGRYRAINDWERYLTENGFRIVKLYLNLSREEQRRRFLRRIDLADHNWKFEAADVAERAHWDGYQRAYSDMLSHTSTEWAPWHVIPADRRWLCRIGAGAVLVIALMDIDPRFPRVDSAQPQALLEARRRLETEADTDDVAARDADMGAPAAG